MAGSNIYQVFESNVRTHDFNLTQTHLENEKGENIFKHMLRNLTQEICLISNFRRIYNQSGFILKK